MSSFPQTQRSGLNTFFNYVIFIIIFFFKDTMKQCLCPPRPRGALLQGPGLLHQQHDAASGGAVAPLPAPQWLLQVCRL